MPQAEHNQQILDEAAVWFVDVREGDVDAAGRQEFIRWLRRSPEHIKAYLEVAAFWADVPQLAPDQQVDVEALVQYALGESNVIPLHGAAPSRMAADPGKPATPLRVRKSRYFLAAAASVALLALAATSAWWLWANRGQTYATTIGEQRSVTLTDGSMIDLNAKSIVRVRFSARSRDVELLEGQAMFTVARDASRPFTVSSDATRVRAIGTQFVVYRRKSGTTVTVLEGKVSVVDGAAAAAPVAETAPRRAVRTRASNAGSAVETQLFLTAGEQVILGSHVAASLKLADVAAATAWTQRQIVFQGAPLTDVVEEFNRYNLRQMVIDDVGLESVRVSGMFSSTQPDSLLRFLREQVGLRVSERESTIEIARR